jgi:hypothetical protein
MTYSRHCLGGVLQRERPARAADAAIPTRRETSSGCSGHLSSSGGDVPGLSVAEDLAPAGTVVQFGVPPNRIDLINEIEGVSFGEAWQGRVECRLVAEGDETSLWYLGLDELIKNKRATGRPKDFGRPGLSDRSRLTPETGIGLGVQELDSSRRADNMTGASTRESPSGRGAVR